jgi:lipopolysaccharide/colanic/teichoic acid biosynthesis glycosyltransferase
MDMVSKANPHIFEVPVRDGAPHLESGRMPMGVVLDGELAALAAAEPLNVRHSFYIVAKTIVEWLLALLLLVVCSPLVAALAAAVRLTSRGPAFYAQTRLGLGGRRYRIYKLRTMVHDAEAGTGPVWASLAGDVRVTPLGRVLRATHLDELPQLWNVLRGEMGLIGPRPERPEIAGRVERKVGGYRGRLAVRPGVTGLAQMLLPADDPSDPALGGLRRKLAHDLYYVRNVSAGLDLRIAVATPCYFLAEAARAAGGAAAGALTRLRRGVLRGHAMAVPALPEQQQQQRRQAI